MPANFSIVLADQMWNAMGKRPRLATPRTGHDREGALVVIRYSTLKVV